jgi:hypothetical protein
LFETAWPDEGKKVPSNSWAFPSVKDGFIAGGLCALTILFTYLTVLAYPDTMPGRTWIVSLIAFAPLMLGCLVFRHCFSQMLMGSGFLEALFRLA